MKYYVRMARPRLEISVIEVDAADPEDAELRAGQVASRRGHRWKLVKYKATDYAPHPEALISQEEVDDALADDPDCDPLNELGSIETFGGAAYLLMFADPESGEGQIIWQPWLGLTSILMQADLCEDWRQDLEVITPEDPFEGMESFDEARRMLAKILLFRRRRPRNDEDDGNDEPPSAA